MSRDKTLRPKTESINLSSVFEKKLIHKHSDATPTLDGLVTRILGIHPSSLCKLIESNGVEDVMSQQVTAQPHTALSIIQPLLLVLALNPWSFLGDGLSNTLI